MNNLMVFGSYARGDFTLESDIDLLGITEDEFSSKVIKGKVNISLYKKTKMKSMANNGSLFVYHLKTEGKILYDTDNWINDLFENSFSLKKHYWMEKTFSFELIKDILNNYDNINNVTYAHSKITWALRTIFSAIGAENKIPFFAKSVIKREFGSQALNFLDIKYLKYRNEKLLNEIVQFSQKIIGPIPNIKIKLTNDLEVYRSKIFKNLDLFDVNDSNDFY